jgi:hypothetical protein
MTAPDLGGLNVAAELASLRGEMSTGFAEVKGELKLIHQAQAAHTGDIDDLKVRVTALEARRWPLGVIGVLSAVVSAVVAAIALMVGQ